MALVKKMSITLNGSQIVNNTRYKCSRILYIFAYLQVEAKWDLAIIFCVLQNKFTIHRTFRKH